MNTKQFTVTGGKGFRLSDIGPDFTNGKNKGKDIDLQIEENIKEMARLQDMLYAYNKYGILIILQAMDAAGKDSAIKHIMSGFNPQGVNVTSFQAPSAEEIDHDYLWKSHQHIPSRGNIAIFNRSYYEDVIVVKIHNLLEAQNIPEGLINKNVWQERYRQIRDFEKYMEENGIIVIKFFLHISKEEQRKRLLERLENPDKNWKFSAGDLVERKQWDNYQETYEEMIRETSTDCAPWYVIPANKKWFARLLISEIIKDNMSRLPIKYPEMTAEDKNEIESYKKQLSEKG